MFLFVFRQKFAFARTRKSCKSEHRTENELSISSQHNNRKQKLMKRKCPYSFRLLANFCTNHFFFSLWPNLQENTYLFIYLFCLPENPLWQEFICWTDYCLRGPLQKMFLPETVLLQHSPLANFSQLLLRLVALNNALTVSLIICLVKGLSPFAKQWCIVIISHKAAKMQHSTAALI